MNRDITEGVKKERIASFRRRFVMGADDALLALRKKTRMEHVARLRAVRRKQAAS